MSTDQRVQEVYYFVLNDAERIIRKDRGEASIREDLIQDAFVAILESEYVSPQKDMWTARRTMENSLARHRERGYKTTLWQDSTEDLE